MLRHVVFSQFFITAVLLVSGSVSSQRNTAEVSMTKCWQFPAQGILGLTTNGRDIFSATEGGHMVAVSSKGEKLWQTDLGGEIVPLLKVEGDEVWVTTRSSSGSLASSRLSATTGLPASMAKDSRLESNKNRSDEIETKASIGDLIILGDNAGLVTSISGSGPVWKFKTGGGISAVVPFEDKFIIISRDNFVYALRAKNGGLEWKRRTQGRLGHYAIGKGFLFVSSLDQHGGTILDLASGRVAGQIVLNADEQVLTDPIILGDELILATDNGLTNYSLGACGASESGSTPYRGGNRFQKQFQQQNLRSVRNGVLLHD
jgi:hypothetical protein